MPGQVRSLGDSHGADRGSEGLASATDLTQSSGAMGVSGARDGGALSPEQGGFGMAGLAGGGGAVARPCWVQSTTSQPLLPGSWRRATLLDCKAPDQTSRHGTRNLSCLAGMPCPPPPGRNSSCPPGAWRGCTDTAPPSPQATKGCFKPKPRPTPPSPLPPPPPSPPPSAVLSAPPTPQRRGLGALSAEVVARMPGGSLWLAEGEKRIQKLALQRMMDLANAGAGRLWGLGSEAAGSEAVGSGGSGFGGKWVCRQCRVRCESWRGGHAGAGTPSPPGLCAAPGSVAGLAPPLTSGADIPTFGGPGLPGDPLRLEQGSASGWRGTRRYEALPPQTSLGTADALRQLQQMQGELASAGAHASARPPPSPAVQETRLVGANLDADRVHRSAAPQRSVHSLSGTDVLGVRRGTPWGRAARGGGM